MNDDIKTIIDNARADADGACCGGVSYSTGLLADECERLEALNRDAYWQIDKYRAERDAAVAALQALVPALRRLADQAEIRRLALTRGGRHKFHDELVDAAAEDLISVWDKLDAAAIFDIVKK